MYIFVSLLAWLRENGWTDLHEIFREGAEWPLDDLITFLVNSEKPRDAAMRNTGTGLVVLSHHSLFSSFICYLLFSESVWYSDTRQFLTHAVKVFVTSLSYHVE